MKEEYSIDDLIFKYTTKKAEVGNLGGKSTLLQKEANVNGKIDGSASHPYFPYQSTTYKSKYLEFNNSIDNGNNNITASETYSNRLSTITPREAEPSFQTASTIREKTQRRVSRREEMIPDKDGSKTLSIRNDDIFVKDEDPDTNMHENKDKKEKDSNNEDDDSFSDFDLSDSDVEIKQSNQAEIDAETLVNKKKQMELEMKTYKKEELLGEQEKKEILKLIGPKLKSLKNKDKQLSNLHEKANSIVREYQTHCELLKEKIKSYEKKKAKIKPFVKDLSSYRQKIKESERNLGRREEELLAFESRNKEIESLYKKEIQSLNADKENFLIAKANKTKELEEKEEDLKRRMEELLRYEVSCHEKDNELKERQKRIDEQEKSLNKRLLLLEEETYKNDIKIKEFELKQEEFFLFSEGVLEKHEGLMTLKDDLDRYNKSIAVKEKDINSKLLDGENFYNENKRVNEYLKKKEKDLDEGLKLLASREEMIKVLQNDLEEKICYYTVKTDEIHKLNQELFDKENLLKLKRNVEVDLDLKLAGLTLAETTVKKKIKYQHKQMMTEFKKLKDKEKDIEGREDVLKRNNF